MSLLSAINDLTFAGMDPGRANAVKNSLIQIASLPRTFEISVLNLGGAFYALSKDQPYDDGVISSHRNTCRAIAWELAQEGSTEEYVGADTQAALPWFMSQMSAWAESADPRQRAMALTAAREFLELGGEYAVVEQVLYSMTMADGLPPAWEVAELPADPPVSVYLQGAIYPLPQGAAICSRSAQYSDSGELQALPTLYTLPVWLRRPIPPVPEPSFEEWAARVSAELGAPGLIDALIRLCQSIQKDLDSGIYEPDNVKIAQVQQQAAFYADLAEAGKHFLKR